MRSQPSKPRQDLEHKKPIVHTSYGLALSRAIVHVVPVSISTGLIALNLKHHYIGSSLGSESGQWTTAYTLAVLQVAAKIQVPTNIESPFADDGL